MNRTLFYPLLLACGLSLSACDTASANSPEFSLEVEYTAIGRPQIVVTSLNDQVTIQKVLINGGKSKCRVMLRNDIGGQLGGDPFPVQAQLHRKLAAGHDRAVPIERGHPFHQSGQCLLHH
ncbi:hypothetical protein PY368_23075 [Aeromonas hydrophila]|uniref:hypothetical protein n=1 Tax=Aeromonas hydrophila TaxID=644 RepID=UPI0023E3AED9|nr:hypothetical protein [Aeromonas hydrophila]WES93296.1 hypothetical protein PY368_23075 [Aeromonas hydrophila]